MQYSVLGLTTIASITPISCSFHTMICSRTGRDGKFHETFSAWNFSLNFQKLHRCEILKKKLPESFYGHVRVLQSIIIVQFVQKICSEMRQFFPFISALHHEHEPPVRGTYLLHRNFLVIAVSIDTFHKLWQNSNKNKLKWEFKKMACWNISKISWNLLKFEAWNFHCLGTGGRNFTASRTLTKCKSTV